MQFPRVLSQAAGPHHRKSQASTRLLAAALSSLIFLLSGCSYETALPATGIQSPPTEDHASAPSTETQPILPPQGLYDSCVPSSADCLSHLDALAAKGFRLVLNYGLLYGGKQGLLAYADHAAALKMQVIWPLSYRAAKPDNWMVAKYEELASDSGCADNPCMIGYVVSLVKDHPATWGYYVADEVKPKEYSNMKPWTDLIKQLDPSHPRLFVTAGSNDPMEQYYGFYS